MISTLNLVLEKIYLGRFPIMLRSKLCILSGFTRDIRYTIGDCTNDLGGYSIIDGKEKKIISQVKLNIPTYSKKNLPYFLKKIPVTSPGSRRVK